MDDIDIEKIKRKDAQATRELFKILPYLYALAYWRLARTWSEDEMVTILIEPDELKVEEYAYDALFAIYDTIDECKLDDGGVYEWCRWVGVTSMKSRPQDQLIPGPRYVSLENLSVEELDRYLLVRTLQRLI